MTTTSPDAAQTLQCLVDAFVAGDLEAFGACWAEDVEIRFAEHHPFLQRCRGREQLLSEVVGKVAAELGDYRPEAERILACEAAAVSQMRYRGVVHATGRRFDIQAVWVCDIQDGKVVRMQEYLDTLAFKEAYAAPS